MISPREALRSRVQETLSGQGTGMPQWVLDLDQGTDRGFFGPESATWAVHHGMPTLVAGIRALLMQAMHPGALAGVWDWSTFREDPLGRLNNTIQWIFTVSYGDTRTAINGSNWVLRLHERVVGDFIDGHGVSRRYSANDPELLRWVHIAFTDSFLAAHQLWGDPIPGGADAYVREWAKAGELMGVERPPQTTAELAAQIAEFADAGELAGGPRVQEVIHFIRRPPLRRMIRPAYPILFNGAVASIPPRYRALLELKPRPLAIPTTRLVLSGADRLLGNQTAGERAARRRLARLDEQEAAATPAGPDLRRAATPADPDLGRGAAATAPAARSAAAASAGSNATPVSDDAANVSDSAVDVADSLVDVADSPVDVADSATGTEPVE